MVFETLVTEVLNRFLGSYVENLDTKQLNIGIWGGDVVLKNLVIKSTALSDLNLPIKLYQGHLGKLTLKIPWKNLYSAPVIATIDSLYVLLVPNSVVKYDEISEEKAIQEIKQKELEKIEEAKKKQELLQDANGKQDTFVEKLVSQIIKNLQIKITSIHLRYEDTYSNPEKPFAFGLTLNYLSFDTTDENWKPCIATEAIKMIYKIVRLDALSVYWNRTSKESSFITMDRDELMMSFLRGIANSSTNSPVLTMPGTIVDTRQITDSLNGDKSIDDKQLPNGYTYVLKPLTSLAQLRLNPKPELDNTNFTTPKMLLNLIIQGITIALSQTQYQDILELLESVETLSLKSKYRKYRPDLNTYEGHYPEWWRFSQRAVLDEIVKPRLIQWSWEHIKNHRDLVKRYTEAYKIKLTSKKLPIEVKTVLDRAEKKLDVFNITIARQKASVEVQRISRNTPEANQGWFSGWFRRSDKGTDSLDKHADTGTIAAKINEAMTGEERRKLYEAIDYTETGVPPEYPREFVQNVYHFKLVKLSLSLFTHYHAIDSRLTDVSLNGLGITFEQCPGANASQIEVNMDNFNVRGKSNYYEKNPMIVKTIKSESKESLINVLFESNPLDGSCDQRLHLQANPLQIIYDAGTINELGQFFKPPESIKLKQLQNAAVSTFEDVKQNTATGYKYALEKRKILDLKFNIKSSHIIIPNDGIYKQDSDMILLDLGNFSLYSLKDTQDIADFTAYITRLSPETETDHQKNQEIENLMQQSYDKIELKIDRIQLLYASKGDDWKSAKNLDDSPLHILKPGQIKILLEKAIIMDDPNIPKIRIFGVLPDLSIDVIDQRLENILQLLLSIPLPENQSTSQPHETFLNDDLLNPQNVKSDTSIKIKGGGSKQTSGVDEMLLHNSDDETFKLAEKEAVDGLIKDLTDTGSVSSYNYNVQLTSLVMNIEIKLIQLNLYRVVVPQNPGLITNETTTTNLLSSASMLKKADDNEKMVASFVIKSLGAYVESRTFDTIVKAHLKTVLLQNFEYADPASNTPLYLVSTPAVSQHAQTDQLEQFFFLRFQITLTDINGPNFVNDYQKIEKKIDVKLCPLNLKVHQQAILKIMQMAERLQKRMAAENSAKKASRPSSFTPKELPMAGKSSLQKGSLKGGKSNGAGAHMTRKRFLTQAHIPEIDEEDEMSWDTAPTSLISIQNGRGFKGGAKKRFTYPHKAQSLASPSQITNVSGLPGESLPQTLQYRTPPSSLKPEDSALSSNLSGFDTAASIYKRQSSSVSTFNKLKEQPLVMSPRKNKNNEEVTDMYIDVHIQSVSINLCNVTDNLATISITGLKSNIQMRRDKTDIQAELIDISIVDNLYDEVTNQRLNRNSPPRSTSYYRQILGGSPINIGGSENLIHDSSGYVLLKGKITIFNNGPGNQVWINDTTPETQNFFKKNILHDMSRVDTLIDVSMGGVRIVVLMPFFNKILYVLESFLSSDTKSKMAEASAAAAVEVASSSYASVSRNLLRIEMKAPVFIIPRSNSYPDAALLDLGTLRLTNRFTLFRFDTPKTTTPGASISSTYNNNQAIKSDPAILDKLMIELTDFKVSRIITTDSLHTGAATTTFKSEVMILEPSNINLEVRRNLTFSSNTSLPEIDVTGHLSKLSRDADSPPISLDTMERYGDVKGLELSMSEEDLNCIMMIVNDNLTTTVTPQPQSIPLDVNSNFLSVDPKLQDMRGEDTKIRRPSQSIGGAGHGSAGERRLSNLRKSIQAEIGKGIKSTIIPTEISKTATPDDEIKSSPQTIDDSSSPPTTPPTATITTSPVKINFRFQFDKIAAALFYGSSELDRGGVCKRNNTKALSRVQLLYIHLIGNLRVNNDLDTKISMYDLILEDSRPQLVNGITRLIEMRKTGDDLELQQAKEDPIAKDRIGNLINLRFQKDHDENMKINAGINRLYICVCIDFLTSVTDFFTKNMPKTKPENSSQFVNNNNNCIKPKVAAILPPPPSKKDKTVRKAVVIPKTSFALRLSLNDPEIVLIENPLDVTTKALILTLQLSLIYDQTPRRTFIDGKLDRLQIIACPLPKHMRENNISQILIPFNLDLTCDSANIHGQKIFAKASDIILNISPATIRVLTAATKIDGPPKPADTKEELLSLPDNLWSLKSLNECNYWFLETEIGDEAIRKLDLGSRFLPNEEAEDEAEQLAATYNPNLDDSSDIQESSVDFLEQLDLSLNSILITVEAGVENRTVPMIKTQIKILNAQLQDWSSNGNEMKAHLRLTLEAGYYNEYLALWEPLIEPLISHYKESDYSSYETDMEFESLRPLGAGDIKIQRPWGLSLDFKKHPEYSEEEFDFYNTTGSPSFNSKQFNENLTSAENSALLPATYIGVSSRDLLNVTLSKCCLQMITNLSTAFGDAVNQKEPKMLSDEMNAPYIIINRLGIDIQIQPDDNLKITNNEGATSTITQSPYITVPDTKKLPLFVDDLSAPTKTNLRPQVSAQSTEGWRPKTRSSILETDKGHDYFINLKFPEFGESVRKISVKQVRRLFIEIPVEKNKLTHLGTADVKDSNNNNNIIGVSVDIVFLYGCKRITVQSPLQVINYFAIPIEIYTMEPGDTTLTKLIVLEMDQNWDVPIRIAYKYPRLFFKPANEPYNISRDSVDWRSHPSSLNSTLKYVISCLPHNPQYEAFYLSITEITENIFGGSENAPIRDYTNSLYRTLHIMPTVTLINLLPYTITHKLSYSNTEVKVEPGCTSALYNACVGKSNIEIKVKEYIERDWICTICLNPNFIDEFQVKPFTAPSKRRGGKIYSLDMGLHWFRNKGMIEISIFCPYWMINQTGLNLSYQQADAIYHPSPLKKDGGEEEHIIVEHKPGLKLPILFSFKPKTFFSKKKACVKVLDSDWSEKFSLDTVGSSGVVSCKTIDSSYEIGVDIVLSKTGFTKIVTFVPYYTVNNKSKLDIQFIEYFDNLTRLENGKWQTVKAGEVIPFWPKQSPTTKGMALVAKFLDSTTCTSPFLINKPHSTLMRLDNKYGGINVECHVTEIAVTITFDQYYHGQAVLLIINHTGEETIQYYQGGTKDVFTIPPRSSILYSWQNALLDDKYLVWSCGEKKNQKFDTIKDSFGDFLAIDKHRIYWVSFLDGTQRVLMFTEDLALICIAQQAGELEKVDQEIELNLEGISLSLVDNWEMMTELTYMSVISSGQPVWEISSTSLTLPSTLLVNEKNGGGSGVNGLASHQTKMLKLSQTLVQSSNKTKFKSLKSREAVILESAYQHYSHDPSIIVALANKNTIMMSSNGTNLPLAKRYNNQLAHAASNNIFTKSGLFLDLDHMVLLKLKSNNINNINNASDISYYYSLRRTFRPGFWIQYKTSPHQVQLHAKLNKLQIDDQLPACTFPVILGLMPLPKSISNDSSVPKPFVELSLLKRNTEHGGVPQVKYFKVLIQETFLRSDQGYIDAVVAFFTQSVTTSIGITNAEQSNLIHENFLVDLEMAKQDLVRASADKVKTTGQKVFYDFLHFSPIKIHLSFSLQSNRSTSLLGKQQQQQRPADSQLSSRDASIISQTQQQQPFLPLDPEQAQSFRHNNLSPYNTQQLLTTPSPAVLGMQGSISYESQSGGGGGSQTAAAPAIKSAALNFLLQSVGVTLADIDDVVFKLGYFERTYQFYTQSQLIHEVSKHYAAQALKQMYVLVLGLDVLGNPFGLIRGLTEGMGDLFYEPYQGAIQGPEEFAQGLALGVRSLFGHTIGGAAGAVSRITGTLGKGLAALTMDQDYQKSRREEMNKKPADFKEGVARGGKGLVMGFYEGVTGIVKKPIEGAKQEGAAGFFKGFGKGLVGVVARPTSGVVDFASSSFQGIKRLAENVEEVHRLRPRRYIHKDHVIRPYDFDEAEGYEIFRAVEKGHMDQSYVYHTFLSPNMKTVLILTNQSVFLISKGELFGQWVIDWSYDWNQITKAPVYIDKLGGIRLDVQGESRKKKCIPSLIPKEDENYRVIPIKNKERAETLMGKMTDILDNSTRGL